MCFTLSAVAMSKILNKLKKKIKFPRSIQKEEKVLVELEKIFNNKDFFRNFLKEYNRVEKKETNPNSMFQVNAYKPQIKDLIRIFEFTVLNNRTTILEFGSGWSTLVFSIAMDILEKQILKIRRATPFKIFSLENEKKFLNITKKRLSFYYKKNTLNNVNLSFSNCKITNYKNKFCIEYEILPNCNPDLIYIDGPDIFNVKGKVQGLSYKNKDFMPIICDILKFEYFLIPGTLIIMDGRTANAQFLADNFKREWIYYYDKKYDQNLFYLDAPSLGRINDDLLSFYSEKY